MAKLEDSNAEKIIRLRKRVLDAVKVGVLDQESKPFYEATLIQILNEAERNRQKCMSIMDDHKKKIIQAEAQANAYSQISSVLYNVLNGFVEVQERALAE